MPTSADHAPHTDQRTLVEAFIALLPHNTTPDAPLTLASGTSVTVLHEDEPASRATRDTIRSVLHSHWVTMHELSPAPPVGAIPAPWQTDLVVAADSTLSTAALRCAARWDVPALVAERDFGGGPVRLVRHTDTAVAVTMPGHGSDVATRRLRLESPVTCSRLTGQPRTSEGLLVEPALGGLALTLDAATTNPRTRTVSGPITVTLRHDTMGLIDGVPHVLPRGHSYLSHGARPLTRLVPTTTAAADEA